MNWDQVAGKWDQLRGAVKQRWGRLTDDDLTIIAGKRTELAGKLREKYGYAEERAEEELDKFLSSCEKNGKKSDSCCH